MFQCPGVVGPTQTRLSGIKGGRDMKLDKVGLEGWEKSEKNMCELVNMTKINFMKLSEN